MKEMSERNGKTILKTLTITFAVLCIVGYTLYQAQNIIKGPQLNIEWPHNGTTVQDAAVAIRGIAQNVAYISLNDRQIFIDNQGNFNEELLLAPGYNIWTLKAKDKFGRSVTKKIELIFDQPVYTSL
jgi:hypothetical protein